MKPTVHILATVRKPELLDAALLVFRTLRTGFPTANVHVWGNGLNAFNAAILANAATLAGAAFNNLSPVPHDAWIEGLIEESLAPFWICDTDIVFWQPVEAWFDSSFVEQRPPIRFAGRFEKEFDEEWTGTRHMERLHTALMWFNPGLLRSAMRQFMSRIPAPWGHSADFPFVRQHFVPLRNRQTLFYDTCAGLWHAGIGTPFNETQDAAFDHLHCATYADVIKLGNGNLQAGHQMIYQNHELARDLKKHQDGYYNSRALAPLKEIRTRKEK